MKKAIKITIQGDTYRYIPGSKRISIYRRGLVARTILAETFNLRRIATALLTRGRRPEKDWVHETPSRLNKFTWTTNGTLERENRSLNSSHVLDPNSAFAQQTLAFMLKKG